MSNQITHGSPAHIYAALAASAKKTAKTMEVGAARMRAIVDGEEFTAMHAKHTAMARRLP
jgi:hypothetical protein